MPKLFSRAVSIISSILLLTANFLFPFLAAQARSDTRPQSKVYARPCGLYVCRGLGPTPLREVNYDFVDGWLVRPAWRDVEPQRGKFDWSYIRSEIALAKSLGKKVTVCVLGGPEAPDWLYASGVPSFSYNKSSRYWQYGQPAKIPIIWDPGFLTAWCEMVHEFGRQFDNDETVTLIHITGSAENGLESQLPHTQVDVQNWLALGYTADKVIAAWKRIIDAYGESFATKPLDIDIHPDFFSNRIATKVAEYGYGKLGKQFGIFGGWLSGINAVGDPHHAGMHEIANKYGHLSFADFEFIGNQTRQPERFDGGIPGAINQGMNWGANYFEVWQNDSTNPQMHPMLTQMHEKIWAACGNQDRN